MWKKIERVLDKMFIVVVCFFCVLSLTSILACLGLCISVVIPKTKTNFKSYQVYLDNPGVKESSGSFSFERELPIGAEDIKYYSYYFIGRSVTAYSMVLPENTYMDFQESRINSYIEESDKWESCSLLYVLQRDEHQYIDDSEWYDVKLDYVDNVLRHPEAQQQYYFGVIMKTSNTVKGECYAGIIANDLTHEIIEFSADLPEEYGVYKEPEQHSEILGWIFQILPAALIIWGMFALDKKLDKKLKNKSNKDQG